MDMSQPTTSSCNRKKKIQYFLALMMTFANKVAKFRTTFQFSELIRILLVITLGTYKTMPRQQSMKTLTGHHRRRKFPVYFIYSLLKCKSLPNNWKFKKKHENPISVCFIFPSSSTANSPVFSKL